MCEEIQQFLRIADSDGFDAALAFSKGPLVATEDQRKRLSEARASVSRVNRNAPGLPQVAKLYARTGVSSQSPGLTPLERFRIT